MIRRYVLALLSLCGFLFCAEAVADEKQDSPSSLIPESLQPLVKTAKDISSVWSGVTDAIKVLQWLGVIQKDPSNQELFDKLDKEFTEAKKLFGIDYDQGMRMERDEALRLAKTGSRLVDEAVRDGTPLDPEANTHSLDAVNLFLTSSTQFTRLYIESATDGGTDWKRIIPDRVLPDAQDPERSGLVFDWRYSLAHYLTVVAIRLKVFTAHHPAWRDDGNRDDELQEIANNLLSRLQTMLDGVRCNFQVFAPKFSEVGPDLDRVWEVSTGIACADIYTGVSSVQILPQLADFNAHTFSEPNCDPFVFSFTCNLGENDADFLDRVIDITESLYRRVLLQLPIYELRSMIDTLHLYLSHAPDLTATLQRIPVERPPASPGLCLAVQDPAVGSGAAVVLLPCTGEDRQRWVYTRAAQPDNPITPIQLIPGGEIRNPLTDKCLDVPGSSPLAHTRLQIFDCNGTGAQKWTYDPMTRVLQSAVSTVLDNPGGDQVCWPDGRPVECIAELPDLFFPPNGLRMWWRTEDASQQWHVDPPFDLNADGKVNCSDLAIVRGSFGKRSVQAGFDFRADINRDGVVDVRDLALVARRLPVGAPCP
jgi:hypothetical protein